MMASQVMRFFLIMSVAGAALIGQAEESSITHESTTVVETEAGDDNPAITTENPEESEVELELVTRGIYQCLDHGKTVFVDQDNRSRYSECKQIRAPHYQQKPHDDTSMGQQGSSPCSGALIYQGSTYIFNDYEPCPIPDDIFQSRTPIQANPEYYSQ